MALTETVGNVTAKFPVPSGTSIPVAYSVDTETVNVPSTESVQSGTGFDGCCPGSTQLSTNSMYHSPWEADPLELELDNASVVLA